MWLLWAVALAGAAEWNAFSDPAGDWLSVRWTDSHGARHDLRADFPPDALGAAPILSTSKQARLEAKKLTIEAWNQAKGYDLSVTLDGDSVRWRGPRSQLAVLQEEKPSVYAQPHPEHFFRVLKPDGPWTFDHAAVVLANVEAVRPLAQALGPMLADRELAVRALALMQQIPYFTPDNGDFRTPLAVVRDRQGDCDEKVVLYAALIRAVSPELPLAVMRVPGHAFIGLGLDVAAGQQAVTAADREWLVAEPVGPRVSPLGEVSEKTRAALERGDLEVLVIPAYLP